MWFLLWACKTAKEIKGSDTGEYPAVLYGRVGDPETDVGVVGIRVEDPAYGVEVETGLDGRWELHTGQASYVMLRFTGEGWLPLQAWISYSEAADPVRGYATRIGSEVAWSDIFLQIHEEEIEGRALVFVDVLDEGMGCIGGVPVVISADHGGAWREVGVGEWRAESVSNSDLHDLLFINVVPGPFEVMVEAPEGMVCEGSPGLWTVAGEVTQVSVYCR